jgi:uncharacterized protein (TIGR04255 family)
MAKRKQYKKPPLIEVFTEFFFQAAEGVVWDNFIVPKFYRRIATAFPTRQPVSSLGIQVRIPGGGNAPEFEPFSPPIPRHRFVSEDEKTLVQLGENLLVVNQLPPYYGWEKYEPRVVECFALYVKLWKPRRVARAAVHYLDKVDLPEAETGLEKYFNLLPVLPEFPQAAATNLTISYEVPGANEGDILVVTMKQTASADPDGMSFLFQWDYVAPAGLPADRSAVQRWLRQAHDFLSGVFLNTFTDECRKLFE